MKVQISCKSFLESWTCELNPLDLICTFKFCYEKTYMFLWLCVIFLICWKHTTLSSHIWWYMQHNFLMFFQGISNAMQFVSHPTTFTPSKHDLKFSMFLWSYQNNLKTNWKLQSTSLSQLIKFQSCFLRILKVLHAFHTWEFWKNSHLKHTKCFETWLGWNFRSHHTKTSNFFTSKTHKMFWNMAWPNIMKLTCQNSKVFHIWNMAWSKFLKPFKHCEISSLLSKHWKALK
jgi:hypothetical protein